MPDSRKHRGPHPADEQLFEPDALAALRQAVDHFSWLLTRGYTDNSALKLVGDRFQLAQRQRIAVMRSSCSDQAKQRRKDHELHAEQLAGQSLDIDGFNLLTTVEAAVSGGVILCGRDGCFRDMASMHGSYRKVEETRPALEMVGTALNRLGAARCLWLLDSPVSNSGRLAEVIREVAVENGWQWEVQLVTDPDAVLIRSESIVVSADSMILDGCARWFNLAPEIIRRQVPQTNIVNMADPADS